MSIEPSVRKIVGKDNVHAFASWAFGPNYEEINGQTFIPVWNNRHGHKYKIDENMAKLKGQESDVILIAMEKLWREENRSPISTAYFRPRDKFHQWKHGEDLPPKIKIAVSSRDENNSPVSQKLDSSSPKKVESPLATKKN